MSIAAFAPLRPRQAIEALVSGYKADKRARKVLVVLQGYIDDSGSDKRADKRLVLAGYIQTAEVWAAFSDDWALALAADRSLPSLHMIKSFRGFSDRERAQKLDKLAAVIAKHRPLSIEVSVSRKDYTEILQANMPYDFRHPYFPCFVGVLQAVSQTLIEEGLSGPIDLIFDDQGNVGHSAVLWYSPFKLADPKLAAILGGTPIFRSDEDVLPLQAADMLAWHVRRVSEPEYSSRDEEIANAIRLRHRYLEIPRETIVTWARQFSSVPGIDEITTRKGSVKHVIGELVATVPEHRIIPILESIERRARRFQYVKLTLEFLGLHRWWKKIAKKKFTLR